FGRQVEQEVVKKLVQESFGVAASQHQIEPVADPVVDAQDLNIARGKAFHYSARVEVRAQIDPKDYFSIDVGQRPAKVSDEQIDRAIERKREELTEYKVIEGRAEMVTRATDVLVVNVKGTIGDQAIDKQGMMVDLSEHGGDSEPIPGLARALAGIPLVAS